MIEKLECTCIEAYKTRKMRDPNCCACSCDHNDLVEQLAKANERVKELEKNSKDRFIKFAKSNKAVDGKSALFIHALGVAFDKEQLRKEQE